MGKKVNIKIKIQDICCDYSGDQLKPGEVFIQKVYLEVYNKSLRSSIILKCLTNDVFQTLENCKRSLDFEQINDFKMGSLIFWDNPIKQGIVILKRDVEIDIAEADKMNRISINSYQLEDFNLKGNFIFKP